MNRDDLITVLTLRARKSGSGAVRELPRAEIEWLVEPLLRGLGLVAPDRRPAGTRRDGAGSTARRP